MRSGSRGRTAAALGAMVTVWGLLAWAGVAGPPALPARDAAPSVSAPAPAPGSTEGGVDGSPGVARAAGTPRWPGVYPRSGNLTYDVSFDLSAARVISASVSGLPERIVARRDSEGAIRVRVAVADGRVYEIGFDGGAPSYVIPRTESVGETAPTLPLRITADGEAVLTRDGALSRRLTSRALPDGIVTALGEEVFLVPTLPSQRYAHGVLGDPTEPRGVYLYRRDGSAAGRIVASDGAVFETRLAIAADTDADGHEEILLTEANRRVGARFVVYEPDGTRRAVGRANGRGFRWKHLVGAGEIGPSGEREIVGVATPHIGGVVEYYRDRGERLEVVHQRPGYSSHAIGSPNLAMAAIADFTGDARPDLLVPSQNRRSLEVIARTADGSRVAARRDLSSEVTSNLFVGSPSGTPFVVFGTADGSVVLVEARPPGDA